MATLEQLENEINEVKTRNQRVETDKAWETSATRKLVVAMLTYLVIVLFFYSASLPRPWLNAIVPTVGFLLSTLTLPIFKNWWIKKNNMSFFSKKTVTIIIFLVILLLLSLLVTYQIIRAQVVCKINYSPGSPACQPSYWCKAVIPDWVADPSGLDGWGCIKK